MSRDRRAVLKGAVSGLVGLALAPLARPGRAAGEPDVTSITSDLVLLAGLGGNILALRTSDGQVVIDSGAAPHAETVLATLGGLAGGGRINTLFNTHWHLDQIGANEAVGRGAGRIVAHEKTRLRLATDYYLPGEDRYQRALPADAHPTESFYTTGETVIGGREIEYGYLLEAHTDGDIYVRFRDANVIAVGDAVSPARDPVLDWFGGGWIGGRVDALGLLLEISDPETRFVPSYGPIIGRAEVQREHDMMLVLFERLVELVRQGMAPEDTLAAGVMDGLGRTFADPRAFVYAAHKSLWAHHNTLSHDIV